MPRCCFRMGDSNDSIPGKRPDLRAQIAREFHNMLERLGADADLRAIVGRWGDTMDDAEMLAMLREFNATGKVRRPQ